MHREQVRCKLLGVVCVLALAAPAAAQQAADYGDAPDGTATGYPAGFAQTGAFPTTEANDGARALSGDGARLGSAISIETGAADPADPDGVPNLTGTDADDGVAGLVIQLVSIPPPAFLDTVVSVPAGGVGGSYFLNVLIDLNMDGDWGDFLQAGVTEWPVQNLPVTVAADSSVPIRTPFFLFGAGNRLPDPAWMRIAVTPTPVAANWTGTGSFASGEVEDHLVRLPRIGGKPVPRPVVSCPPGLFLFPAGVDAIPFNCLLSNPAPVAGNVRVRLTRETGGVTVATAPPPPGPARQIEHVVPVPANLAAPPIVLPYTARRGALPSDWVVRAKGVDPPSVVDALGVIAGYGDSAAAIIFEAAPEQPRQDRQGQQQHRQEQKPPDK